MEICINCGSEYEVRQDKPHWPDYCDKCKRALKKARDVKKLHQFVGLNEQIRGFNRNKV